MKGAHIMPIRPRVDDCEKTKIAEPCLDEVFFYLGMSLGGAMSSEMLQFRYSSLCIKDALVSRVSLFHYDHFTTAPEHRPFRWKFYLPTASALPKHAACIHFHTRTPTHRHITVSCRPHTLPDLCVPGLRRRPRCVPRAGSRFPCRL